MSDEPRPPAEPGPRAQVNVQVSDELRHGVYANFLVVSHSPHEFTLDFCQIMPRRDADSAVTAEVVSRVKIAPTLVGRVLNALNTNMTNYEEKFGSVKHIG